VERRRSANECAFNGFRYVKGRGEERRGEGEVVLSFLAQKGGAGGAQHGGGWKVATLLVDSRKKTTQGSPN
jgi:hypothetical protein